MTNNYQERLIGDTYRDDVECEVRLEPDPRDEGRSGLCAGMPERLLARLRSLGIAYQLPLLSRLPDNGQVVYPEIQLPSLEEEMVFLFEVVSDEALLRAVVPFREFIGRAKHEPRGWSLIVEAP
jgi:hypothetical protein